MEKITNIEIKNFKSIRHQKIEGCKRINVFIGYPNVGKSNILEALGLFMIGNIADVDIRQLFRFEGYLNLFYNNNVSTNIEVKIDDDEQIELRLKNKVLFLRSQSNRMFFEMEIPFNRFDVNPMEHVSHSSDDYDSLERLQIKKYYFLKNNSKWLPPNFSKELVAPFGENLVDSINANQALKEAVVNIFKEYNLKYATDENNDIKIIKEIGNQEVRIFPYIQMADTLQRLIFYKAAITSNEKSVLLFEEPEAHMFPPYIKELTSDIIFDKNDNQYFIATHSPFVLNELIEEAQEELSVYVVDYDKGETIIKRLTDEEVTEISQYGIDLFFNLESYLAKNGQPHSA